MSGFGSNRPIAIRTRCLCGGRLEATHFLTTDDISASGRWPRRTVEATLVCEHGCKIMYNADYYGMINAPNNLVAEILEAYEEATRNHRSRDAAAKELEKAADDLREKAARLRRGIAP